MTRFIFVRTHEASASAGDVMDGRERTMMCRLKDGCSDFAPGLSDDQRGAFV